MYSKQKNHLIYLISVFIRFEKDPEYFYCFQYADKQCVKYPEPLFWPDYSGESRPVFRSKVGH